MKTNINSKSKLLVTFSNVLIYLTLFLVYIPAFSKEYQNKNIIWWVFGLVIILLTASILLIWFLFIKKRDIQEEQLDKKAIKKLAIFFILEFIALIFVFIATILVLFLKVKLTKEIIWGIGVGMAFILTLVASPFEILVRAQANYNKLRKLPVEDDISDKINDKINI